jgi:serine/threonine-protein kinase
MYAHMNEPPVPVSSLVQAAGFAFDPVVARALAKLPEQRYPSAGDLGRAAVAASAGQQSPVPERSVAAGSAALITQPRVAPTAQQTGPTAQLPVTHQPPQPPVTHQPPQRQPHAWGPPPPPAQRSSKWPIVAVCATILAVGGVAIALAAAGVFKSKGAQKQTTVVIQQPAAAPAAEPTTPAATTPTAPPTTTPPGSSGTATYRAPTYAADYPAGWTIVSDNADKGAYAETKLQSPDGGAAVLIDRTPGSAQDPQLEAAGVESQTAKTPGYRRISFAPATLGGKAGWKWVFGLPSGRRVDYFTNTGGGRFAVLGSGSDFATAERTAREVAVSLR